jgi:hypothetical protein
LPSIFGAANGRIKPLHGAAQAFDVKLVSIELIVQQRQDGVALFVEAHRSRVEHGHET